MDGAFLKKRAPQTSRYQTRALKKVHFRLKTISKTTGHYNTDQN